jgi:hypothetical protein
MPLSRQGHAKTCHDLELRVAAVLDQATAGDLLAVAFDSGREYAINTDTVRRVTATFVVRKSGAGQNRRPSLSRVVLGSRALQKVDEMTEESLPISNFMLDRVYPEVAGVCFSSPPLIT